MFLGPGGLSVGAGVLTFWLPLPIGVPLMALGLALLSAHSRRVRAWLVGLARRFPVLLPLVRAVRQRRLESRDGDEVLSIEPQPHPAGPLFSADQASTP